jgi:TonB-dependent receptor-like protein
MNLAYALDPKTVLRADADRLTITPPTAQGAAVGTVIVPETLTQLDVSAEHQTGPGQSVMVRGFYKHIDNQLDVGLLLPGTQIGAFVTDNIPRDEIHGALFSYNLTPVNKVGTSAYVSYQYALAKPGGPGSNPYNDHDQLHTLSVGTSYMFKHGESAGLVFNFGSGFYSSVVDQPDGPRAEHREFNLRLASSPKLFGRPIQATFEVENLFDQRDLLNFNSGFSGTRFQLGRRLMLTLGGKM